MFQCPNNAFCSKKGLKENTNKRKTQTLKKKTGKKKFIKLRVPHVLFLSLIEKCTELKMLRPLEWFSIKLVAFVLLPFLTLLRSKQFLI